MDQASMKDVPRNMRRTGMFLAGEVECGILEESIRKKGFPIDQRLRRLLGEASREAWEEMQADNEQYHKYHESKTAKDLEAEYQAWSETQGDYDDDKYRELAEAQANWKAFLDSF